MRPQTYLRGSRTALLSLLPLESPRHSTPGRVAAGGVLQALRRLVALAMVLLLLPLTEVGLFAQQGWPQSPQYGNGQYTQYNPYNGPYAPNRQSGYAQPVYAQPSYAQPAYVQPSYVQPNYVQPGYGQPQPYVQQPYAQPSYSALDQGYPQPGYGQAEPLAEPLSPEQLEQLVAPIALYPDTLLAQVLAAATYPAQVVGADHWLQAQPYASPDQIAAGADAQTSWDPSVKALTAFPQVLALMDRNLQWTTDLGNAYYNQPQDVLQTVQVMRQRAQAAGTLQNTPQEEMTYNQGYIELAPANPQVVYVPAYNPWDIYGQPVSPYPGFSLLGALESFAGSAPVRFGLGIAMAAFSHTSFGWMGWALNWLSQSVLFHHANYYSQSTTVAHWASQRGGLPAASQRAVVPNSYNRAQGSYARPANGYNATPGQGFARQPARYPDNYAANRPAQALSRGYSAPQGNYVRPASQSYAYNRPQPQVSMPIRSQSYSPYARPGGYGSGFYGGSSQSYAGRPATAYASPQQAWRAPTPQRGDFGQRSYLGDRSYSASAGRAFAGSSAKPEHTGGFHPFGGHNAEKSYGGGHAPKSFSGGKHSGGGGLFGGHHGGGHHH